MIRHTLSMLSLAVATVALAAEPQQPGAKAHEDPMMGWVPRPVKNEAADKKEIGALFKSMEDAGRTGSLDAAAALIDFPVLMITDDSKGEAKGEPWSKEQWTKVMTPFYSKPNPDMKSTHKPTVTVLTDSLAAVTDQWTMTMGKQKASGRSAMLVVRTDGKWRVKAMVEGGWGDAMKEGPAAGGTGSSTEPAGTGRPIPGADERDSEKPTRATQ
jgi:uncharacterized protein (TIGR02246 family)